MEAQVHPFSERLVLIMDALKVKPAAFAKRLEINTSSLSSLTGARSSEPRLKVLSQIVKKFPRVNENFLLTGEGTPLKPVSMGVTVAGDGNAVANGHGSTAHVGGLGDCMQRLLQAQDMIIRLQDENAQLRQRQ